MEPRHKHPSSSLIQILGLIFKTFENQNFFEINEKISTSL